MAPAIALDLPGFGRSARPAPASSTTRSAPTAGCSRARSPSSPPAATASSSTTGAYSASSPRRRVPRPFAGSSSSTPYRSAPPIGGTGWRAAGAAAASASSSRGHARGGSPTCSSAAPAPDAPRCRPRWSTGSSGTGTRGMARAVLALYRSADRGVLAAAGERLGEIDCPALILWGADDPYIGAVDGRSFERRLPNARFRLDRRGRPLAVDRPPRARRRSRGLPRR